MKSRISRQKGFWLSDLPEGQRLILDIMHCCDPASGMLSSKHAHRAGNARISYSTARLQALAARGLASRHEKQAEYWFPVLSAYAKMEPLS